MTSSSNSFRFAARMLVKTCSTVSFVAVAADDEFPQMVVLLVVLPPHHVLKDGVELGQCSCVPDENTPPHRGVDLTKHDAEVPDVTPRGSLWSLAHPGHCSAPSNGSRLSCGASASGRKHPALRYELVGGQTYASSESRPRQLPALVRQPGQRDLPRRARWLKLRRLAWPGARIVEP